MYQCSLSLIPHLKKVQNISGRLILGISKREHISLYLASLHWLPIESRIKYKTCIYFLQLLVVCNFNSDLHSCLMMPFVHECNVISVCRQLTNLFCWKYECLCHISCDWFFGSCDAFVIVNNSWIWIGESTCNFIMQIIIIHFSITVLLYHIFLIETKNKTPADLLHSILLYKKNKNKKFIVDPNTNSYIIQIHQINQ